MNDPITIRLQEFVASPLQADALSDPEARTLWSRFGKEISIETPSFKNQNQWILTPQGYVGHIPLSDSKTISIMPKVPIRNVFEMLSYAYDLESFRFLPGILSADSLEGFADLLAGELARRVVVRIKKGLYRAYVPREERLLAVRGTIDLKEALKRPGEVPLPCQFDEHLADIEDNRILAWTLRKIAQAGLCRGARRELVRHAYRSLAGAVSIQPLSGQDCVGRTYNRLNSDYRILHAICRFFLDHILPTHEHGDTGSVPFLVDMALLFERFVAGWLRENLPSEYSLETQEHVRPDANDRFSFTIDLVLRDLTQGVLGVMDTKYKTGEPSNADTYQVVSYASALNCSKAVLLYPVPLDRPFSVRFGTITVRGLAFRLDSNLDDAGRELVGQLGIRESSLGVA